MIATLFLLLAQQPDDEFRKVLDLQEKVRACCEKIRPAYVFFGNGSGVCISPDGWVLTNFHVSGDKSGQAVRMTGGKRFTADVVGFDPHGDIALCRIKNAKDLPYLELGDSDQVRVGQHVIAMGNPFLLGNGSWEPTMTFGIISALHRYMDNPGYFDAIQTDAQINPGNSGGPLLTLDGKVIGINGRIDIKRFMNRVNTGIGYAIPSRQIERYMKKFKEGGEVKEGYIDGIRIGECGDARYERVGEYGDGVFVAGITPDTAGARAGFANGDIIFEIEGYRIHNANRFHGVVSNWPQGETVKVKVRRGNAEVGLTVFLGNPSKVKPRELGASPLDLGFSPSADFDDLGVEVEKVDKGGAAEKAGLKPGDIIKKLDGRRVKNWDEFRDTIRSRKPGDVLKLAVLRDGEETEIPLRIPAPKSDE
ncbi:MAG TPA: trypsin-like peptidase domain-containing protein [Planctomycetota bacterium]|nr:trypsin-like peptidase domain-containing protein [Planctomycetota bacterium]